MNKILFGNYKQFSQLTFHEMRYTYNAKVFKILSLFSIIFHKTYKNATEKDLKFIINSSLFLEQILKRKLLF